MLTVHENNENYLIQFLFMMFEFLTLTVIMDRMNITSLNVHLYQPGGFWSSFVKSQYFVRKDPIVIFHLDIISVKDISVHVFKNKTFT